MAGVVKQAEPKPVGCTCDFSSGTRGMDRCSHCDGTGSRLLVVVDGQPFYFPNTKEGWGRALTKLAEEVS
jgi:hypothetical protein